MSAKVLSLLAKLHASTYRNSVRENKRTFYFFSHTLIYPAITDNNMNVIIAYNT
jgi:hypothetical protein